MSKTKTKKEKNGNRSKWATPLHVFDELNREFQFTLDVCADASNTKCPRFFDEVVDGLKQDWSKDTCWLNPPYNNTAAWLEKASKEAEKGAIVVALVPASTDTAWFHKYIAKATQIRLVKGRIQFIPPPGVKASTNDHGSMILVFQPGWSHHSGYHAFTTCKFEKPNSAA